MNLTMFRGDTLVLSVSVTQGGVPVNIAGATFWLTAKKSIDDADVDAAFQCTGDTDVEIIDAAAGLARITITPARTEGIAMTGNQPLTFIYDVQVKTATGIVATIDGGTIKVLPDVTRTSV